MKIKSILGWIFSILLLVLGVLSFFLSYIMGIFIFLAGIFLFPPLGWIFGKNRRMPVLLRGLLIEVCLCLALILYSPNASGQLIGNFGLSSTSTSVATSASPAASAAAVASASTEGLLQVVSAPQKVSPGSTSSVTMKGDPNTEYDMKILYSTATPMTNVKQTGISDSSGKLTFTWTVDTAVKSGTYSITLSGGGQSKMVTFTVGS